MTYISPFPGRWVVVDDTDSRIQYYGSGWFQDRGSQDNVGNFGPAYRSTLHGTKSNASLSFSFSGSRVNVTGSNNLRNDSGVFDPTWECFVDNVRIVQFAPFQSPENNFMFCWEEDLADGPHVITVNVTVMEEQTFWLDNIIYLPSASVPLDNEAILVDNADSAIQYEDAWEILESRGGISRITTIRNSYITFPFTGTSLSWYAIVLEGYPDGSGGYSVDEKDAIPFLLPGLSANSNTAPIYNQKLFETPSYPAGPHKILVTFLGSQLTTPLVLDYLIVQNGTFSSTTAPTTASNTASTIAPTIAPYSSDTPGPTASSHSSKTGPVAGGVVGGLVLFLTIAVILFLYLNRWKKSQKREHVDEDTSSDMVVEPFRSRPTLPPQATTYSKHTPQITNASNSAQHGANPGQTDTKLDSTIPPNSSSPEIPNKNLSNRHQSSDMPSNDGYVPSGSNLRADNNTAYITPRVIHHKDSGVRLGGDSRESEVVEVPPEYTII